MEEIDRKFLRVAIDVARQARSHGNHPFGALLARNGDELLLQAENTVNTEHDCTCHAEMNLIRLAVRSMAHQELAHTTLYTSTEPCPMCSGAIYWSGIRRVVYALSAQSLYRLTGSASGLLLPHSRAILNIGGIEVHGPAIEDEATSVHAGFWSKPEPE